MQTPVEIAFQGMDARPDARAAIDREVAALERLFGRITAGRVVLKAPGDHRRTGGLYEVTIHLTLPDGRSVKIDRTPQQDERYASLNFALNDAFKRARRQLQEQVQRLQGEVKQHEGEGPLFGSVARLDPQGEFGFIETDDGREIYFHRNSVPGGVADLTPGVRVSFAEEMGEKGPHAIRVKLIGKHP